MKEIGLTHWLSPNTGATNESGFTALGSGTRNDGWNSFMEFTYFWSQTSDTITGPDQVWVRTINNAGTGIFRGTSGGTLIGLSIRCVKD